MWKNVVHCQANGMLSWAIAFPLACVLPGFNSGGLTCLLVLRCKKLPSGQHQFLMNLQVERPI
eukprot:895040-Amphidinium_carterae.1